MSSMPFAARRFLLWALFFVGSYLGLSGFASFFELYFASKWPTAEAEIRRSEIVEKNGFYQVQVEYEFTVANSQYRNDNVNLRPVVSGLSISAETMGSEVLEEAAAIRENFSVGKRLTVHYKPGNPNRAALQIENAGFLVIGCIGLFLAFFMWLPLRFPRLFQSVRERLSTDSEHRFGRRQIVFTSKMLCDFSDISVAEKTETQAGAESLLTSPEYFIEDWCPGECVSFIRQDNGVLSKNARYEIHLHWPQNIFRFGPPGSAESIPLNAIQELRIHGKHEVRRTGGGRSGSSQIYEAWDVWLDAIVGSRRIRLASRANFHDPDEAFLASMRSGTPLSISIGVPLRWIGFENHPEYRPPRNIPWRVATGNFSPISSRSDLPAADAQAVSAAIPVASTPVVARPGDTEVYPVGAYEKYTAAKPPSTDISISQTADRIYVKIPRIGRLRGIPGLGIAVVFGLFAAMISPAVFRNPELGPRIFASVLWLAPVICVVQVVRQWVRSGAIEVSNDELTVVVRGLFRKRIQRWSSISRDVLTVCVIPTGEEHNGLPVEQLAVVSVDGTAARFFPERSNRELAWIAQSLRQFLKFPEPPAVTQSQPQKAVVEIARGIASSIDEEMESHAEDVQEMHRRLSNSATEIPWQSEGHDLQSRLEDSNAQILKREKTERARSRLCSEFGLINFESWHPGVMVRFRRQTLDTAKLISASFKSGLGYGLVFLFVVPFVVPILGAFLVNPFDLMGFKQLRFVIADLMRFGPGLVAWVVTFTVLAMAWTLMKLDAAFAPREVEFDWRRRSLSVRTRRVNRSYNFQEIRRIIVRAVKSTQAKDRREIIRMEAELPNRSVVLLEVESSEEVDGIAESATPVQENLKVLAADLAHHLNVQSFLLAPVEDNSDAVGLPRKPHLTHLGRLWQNVSRKTKFLVSSLCVILLLFWTIRAVYSYRSAANTVSASAMPLNAAQYPGYLFSHADAHSGRFGKSLCVATRFECTDFFPTDHG